LFGEIFDVDKSKGDFLNASAELFNITRKLDKKIEPILISTKHDKSGFLESIIKSGKIIWEKEN
jgi:hypothetical protein